MAGASLNFLVVEDERIISLAVELQIRHLGHSVAASVATGTAALEAVERLRPDLVLMDIHLEGALDGIDTARIIRQRGGPPVAFITAYTDAETRARAQAAEPMAFLAKPLRPTDLEALARRLGPGSRPGGPPADARQ